MTNLTFRTFIEQGTKVSATGLNAGGRAGQKQFTPEGPVKRAPDPQRNPDPIRQRVPKTKKPQVFSKPKLF